MLKVLTVIRPYNEVKYKGRYLENATVTKDSPSEAPKEGEIIRKKG